MRIGLPGIIILAIIAAALIILLPFAGMETIGISQLFNDALQKEIFLTLRLPRVLTAFVAGGGLAVCGLVFQGIFRNPMADPFTLGVASGASFGAALTILTGITGTFLGIPIITLGALCGAALSFTLVIAFSSTTRSASSNTILLAGIAASFFFSSLLMFSQYLSDMRGTFRIVRWLMGGVEVFGYGSLLSILPFIAVGLVLIIANAAALDHFLAGEDIAQTRGIRIRRSRSLLLLSATVIVGGIVSICGPIGFVGLMVPHFCRGLFGASHKILLPASLLSGGIFLMICDAFARTVAAPVDIPVGVITALLGGPFLVWVLRRLRWSAFS